MANPAAHSLIALPHIDTSVVHSPQRTVQSAHEPRAQYPRQNSSFSSSANNSPSLLRSTTEAIASALHVDANDLPQPFYGVPWVRDDLNAQPASPVHYPTSGLETYARNGSAASVSPTSHPALANHWQEPTTYWQDSVSTNIAGRPYVDPTTKPSELYGDIPRSSSSFVELDGRTSSIGNVLADHNSRVQARRNGSGTDQESAIITPLSPLQVPARREFSSIVSPLEPNSSENGLVSPNHQPSSASVHGASPTGAPEIPRKASRRLRTDVEQVLAADGGVSRAAVVKPKAGLFEGQLVAFLTLANSAVESSSSSSNDDEIRLQNAYYTSSLPMIRRTVEAQLAPGWVPGIWVALEKMPLTPEGEISRRKLQTWIQNANDEVYRRITSIDSKTDLRKPSTTWERRLSKAVGKVLHVEENDIGMNMSFANLGGDTKTAERLAVGFQSQGIPLDAQDVLQAPTLTDLAALASPVEPVLRPPVEEVAELFDLSPMQHLYFHTPMGKNNTRRKMNNGDYRFNQSILFRLKQSMGVEELRAAIEAIVGYHSMLRSRFCFSNGSWWQSAAPEIASSYEFAHHLIGTEAELETIIAAAQGAINIEHGPVFAAHHFHTHDGYQLLYFVAHHLVVDLRSWQVMAKELEGLVAEGHLFYNQSLTFKEWALHQKHRVQTSTAAIGLPYELPPRNWEYWGVNDTLNTYGNTVAYGFSLESEVISVLGTANKELKTDPCDIFMSALLLSFVQVFRDRSAPILWNQEHERSALDPERDISNTVGWFTYLFPLVVDVSATDDVFSVMSRVKDARRAAAKKSLSHFTTNLMDASSAESFAFSHCPLELIFTYATSSGSVETQNTILEEIDVPGKAMGSQSADIGQCVGRIAIFEVSIWMGEDEAKLKFLHHRDSKHKEQIQYWIRSYERILRQSISRLKDHAPGLALSDVPDFDVTPEGLSRLNREILPRLSLNISNVENVLPATQHQQVLLVRQALQPGSTLSQVTYELNAGNEAIDAARICTAWQQVTSQYPAMRTIFPPSVMKEGLYDQIVLRNYSPNMLFLESNDIEGPLAAIAKVPAILLHEGVPWHRLIVCQSGPKAYLRLEISQAVCDMASIAILFNKLEQVYFNEPTTPPSELSFSEYNQRLTPTRTDVDFWVDKLRQVRPCHFPTLVSQPATPMEWQSTSLDLEIPYQRLRDFARFYKVDLSTIIRVAWGLLLRTYLETEVVCFGYRCAGRDLPIPGLDSAVGPFSRILVCKMHAGGDKTIAQLLKDAEVERQKDLSHQNVSVCIIENALKTKGTRLFNTCVSFGYEDISSPSNPNTRFCRNHSSQSSEYDLGADFNVCKGSLLIELGHRMLTPQQAMTLAQVFGKALESILESASATVKEADMFTQNDHNQILSWNSMPQIEVPTQDLPTLIGMQAQRSADIQAICSWDGSLTYTELFKLSRGLAQHLISSGVRPHMPLPVVVDKSRWAIVAMLAVLTTGATLVPIDAESTVMFPWVVQVINRGLVLASDDVRGYFESSGCNVMPVNGETITSPYVQAVDLQVPVLTKPGDIACLLLTPAGLKNCKAVSYSHGALATACAGQGSTLRLNPSSRVMQLSSYCVDVALSEIFTTLVNGGCVCVPSPAERLAGFVSAARRMKVNWTYLTPPLSRKIDPETLPDIAVVCFRARQLDAEAHRQWMGKAKVILVYGSPESCPLGLSAAEVTESTIVPGFRNPFAGNFWIVSPEDHNRLMPVGAVGELVIGGPTLATASSLDMENLDVDVLIRKSATRARSLLEQSGSRLLKTGHRVRYREQGEIEFVTLEGEKCAIEGTSFHVSDVEPKLRRCFGRGIDVVIETIAFKDTQSTPVLAAFIEIGDQFLDGCEDLTKISHGTRQRLFYFKQTATMALREAVPPYMIPSAYIPVRQLPLTPSLKVNRRGLQKMITGLSRQQLLALSEVENRQDSEFTGLKPLPLTQTEQQMRVMWAQALGMEDPTSITGNDGFITLGGDMVTSHAVIIMCRERGIKISILDILRNVSLSEICRGINPAANQKVPQSRPSTAAQDTSAPKLGSDRSVIEDVAEASSLQTMFVESAMLQARGNVSYFVLSATGFLDWHKLENACFMLTKAHPILRTAFVSHSRQVYQTVLRQFRPEFLRYQCQNWRLNNLAVKLIKRDQPEPIDFRRPVTKFYFLDAGKCSILVMRLSRAQYDDLSIPILVRDMGRFYRQGDLVAQGTGFCEVIRAARSTYASGATEYWRSLLEGASMTQVVSQPSLQVANSSPKTLTQRIPVGSLANFGIPFETILKGAWSIVLSNLSGTDDVVFGQMVEGRHLSLANGQTISSVVGPKGNVIPVRTRLSDYPVTPLEFFKNMQSQYVASVPYENLQTADVIQNCTAWPAWTRFSTVVHHQRQSERYKLLNFTIGEASCTLDMIGLSHEDSDVFVQTMMVGSKDVEISVTFCEKKIQQFFADEVLKMLCSTITVLTSNFVMEPMVLKGLNDSYTTPRIPLPAPKRESSTLSGTLSVDPDHARAAHSVIAAAWDAVLGAQSLQNQVADIRSVPFYEIWGAHMPAAELARFYTQKVPRFPGLEQKVYTTEEIIDHPTMLQQYELIIAKQETTLKPRRSFLGKRGPSSLRKNFRKLTVGTSMTSNTGAGGSSGSDGIVSAPGRLHPHRNLTGVGNSSLDSLSTLDTSVPGDHADPLMQSMGMGMGNGIGMGNGVGSGREGIPTPPTPSASASESERAGSRMGMGF
ncbi:hypothetical protein F5Y16DRAFT_381078 [Xylariaceae sp. FL0255]|nr:hypothetical protein F5Y16DRAFT_381078 [Xylariaceae sp. FL0255]